MTDSYNSMNEEELVRQIIQRRTMLLAYARSIVADAEIAEDVFQDVVVIALKKREQIESVDAIGAWLRKIARYESLNALRKRNRQPALFNEQWLDVIDASWAKLDSSDSEGYVAALQGCLTQLSPKMRQLIDLRYKHELSGKELAEQLKRPVGAIYVSLSRVHATLRKCIYRSLRRQYHNG